MQNFYFSKKSEPCVVQNNLGSVVPKMHFLIVFLFILISSMSGFAQAYQDFLTERPIWGGMWINTGYSSSIDLRGLEDDLAGEAGRLQWNQIETTQGDYDFTNHLDMALDRAVANDYYHYFVLWTGSSVPEWVWNSGTVPKVITSDGTFPYYLDEDYKTYVKNLFNAIADHMAGFSQDKISRLAFIQPGFGATGDRQLYKGTPPSQYAISDDQYVSFMQEMTIAFVGAFARYPQLSNIRFLWNIDDYDGDPEILNPDGEERFGKWMKENYNCQLRKQQYTIAVGYLNSREMIQDDELRANFYGLDGRWGGNPEYVRGEFNENETAPTPLYQLNPNLFYYWTAISSVDRGLDGWEVKYDYLMNQNNYQPSYAEAFKFSNRYSYYKVADKSPLAFVALRDILDYSDTERFPTATYGTASQSNVSRINNILTEYSSYGAANDDMSAATDIWGGITYLKNTTGYNDCLWDVIDRNNQRFISQIDANETSAGYWRVGITQTQPYGRFCRGFDVQNNKNTMYFDVDDLYFSRNRAENDGNLTVKVIYYAEDGGSWSLKYHAQDGTMKTARTVNNAGPGSGWQALEISISDALLNNGGARGADLILESDGQTNCRFHMIELIRNVPSAGTVGVSGVNIDQGSSATLTQGNTYQLTATVSPADASNKAVEWSSTNEPIATVDANGLVTAHAQGTAVITVSTVDGGYTDNCSVTVTAPSGSDETITLKHRIYSSYLKPVSSNEGAAIVQTLTESNATKWLKEDIDGVHFYLRNLETGLILQPASSAIGSLIIQSSASGELAQWSLREIDDYVLFDNRLTTKQFKTVDAAATENGAVDHAGASGDKARWIIEPVVVILSDDATLSDLTVDGSTVAAFAPATLTYAIELPAGTLTVPVVEATPNDANATAVVTNAASLPGSTTVTVTAEDGTTQQVYSVNFTVAQVVDEFTGFVAPMQVMQGETITTSVSYTTSTNRDIQVNIQLNSDPWTGYGSTRITVPSGTATVDIDLAVDPAIPVATGAYKIVASLFPVGGGFLDRIDVEKIVDVDVVPVPLSDDATLSDLTVDGSTVAGFAPATLTYAIELPAGTLTVPVVAATPNDANATAVVTNAASLPGSTTVTVTAEDGTTQQVYSVNFTVAAPIGETLTLINRKSGMYIKPVNSADGAGIVQTSTASDATKWVKQDIDGVYFYLKNLQTGLNLQPVSADNGSSVVQASGSDLLAQWSVRPSDNGFVYLDNRQTGSQIKPTSTNENDPIIHTGGTGWLVQWTLDYELKSLNHDNLAALNEAEFEAEFNVYPNPATSTLFVENSHAVGITQLRIFNLNGQMVYAENLTDQLIAIDLEKLQLKGMIMLQFVSDQKVGMRKIFVQ